MSKHRVKKAHLDLLEEALRQLENRRREELVKEIRLYFPEIKFSVLEWYCFIFVSIVEVKKTIISKVSQEDHECFLHNMERLTWRGDGRERDLSNFFSEILIQFAPKKNNEFK